MDDQSLIPFLGYVIYNSKDLSHNDLSDYCDELNKNGIEAHHIFDYDKVLREGDDSCLCIVYNNLTNKKSDLNFGGNQERLIQFHAGGMGVIGERGAWKNKVKTIFPLDAKIKMGYFVISV
jgi:hypothetical protein